LIAKSNFSSVDSLQKSLINEKIELSDTEKKLLIFISSEKKLAKEFRYHLYPHIQNSMRLNMPKFFDDYNKKLSGGNINSSFDYVKSGMS
jgi:hypothetical protein